MDRALAPAVPKPLAVQWLGLIPYVAAWDVQKRLAAERVEGRSSLEEHILVSRDELTRRGATLVRIERGGEVTYHGPGQLVAYPIIKLEGDERSVSHLVDNLEQAIIETLGAYGI